MIYNIIEGIMHTTRVFQSGNSQAVRLPKLFAFKSAVVYIERRGDEVVLREKPATLAATLANLPMLPADFPDVIEQPAFEERDWDAL